MKQLNVNIAERIATFNGVDEKIIGFNGDYEIKFTFDEEWNAYPKKTARFIWNGMHHDVEFTGDTCAVPIIKGASCFSVGVYVGEEAEDEDIISTTKAIIPLTLSVRCGDSTPQPTTGEHYTNEAKGAAAAAEASAAEAKEAEENVKKVEPKIANNSLRIEKIEDKLGLDGDLVKIESGYKYNSTIEIESYPYVRILKLGSNGRLKYAEQYGGYECQKDYIRTVNGNTVIPADMSAIPYYGIGNSDDERVSNYIFFENGKAYYHQGCRYEYGSDPISAEVGESIIEEVYGDGLYHYIIGLAEPIITDISDKIRFDGVVIVGSGYGRQTFSVGGDGYIEIAYMTKEGA